MTALPSCLFTNHYCARNTKSPEKIQYKNFSHHLEQKSYSELILYPISQTTIEMRSILPIVVHIIDLVLNFTVSSEVFMDCISNSVYIAPPDSFVGSLVICNELYTNLKLDCSVKEYKRYLYMVNQLCRVASHTERPSRHLIYCKLPHLRRWCDVSWYSSKGCVDYFIVVAVQKK